jgi:hypothetical protein
VGAQVVAPDELCAPASTASSSRHRARCTLSSRSRRWTPAPPSSAEAARARRRRDRGRGGRRPPQRPAARRRPVLPAPGGHRGAARRAVDRRAGEVYAADLVFHNAYGPDKPWFRDPALSGGGCVIDLGTHLVDLALHLLAGAGPAVDVESVTARLFTGGRPLDGRTDVVEDFATARIDLAAAPC